MSQSKSITPLQTTTTQFSGIENGIDKHRLASGFKTDKCYNLSVKRALVFSERNLSACIFFIQGLSLVFVWNALVNSSNFFNTHLQSNRYSMIITDVLFSVFTVTRCIFFFLSSFVVERFSPYLQVFISNLICCVIFITFSIISISSLSEQLFILLSVALVFFASIFSVFLYTGNYAILSTLPKTYSQAISLGQGTAGMITCIIKLLTLKFSKSQDGLGVSDDFLYFLLTALLLLLASITFFFFMNIYSNEYHAKNLRVINTRKKHAAEYPSSFDSTTVLLENTQSKRSSSAISEFFTVISKSSLKIKVLWWCNFVICFQTMFFFPSWPQMTASVNESHLSPIDNQMFIVFVLFLFNFGDWIGRIILSFPKFSIHSDRLFLALTLLRFIHAPLYMFGNIVVGEDDSYPLPRIFASDAILKLNTFVLGLSTGYLTTLFLIEAPNRVCNHSLKVKVSFYMLLGLVLAVALGSLADLVLKIVLLSYSK